MNEPADIMETSPSLSTLVISLLKGVLYRENDELLWTTLFQLQSVVRDYVAVLGLELVLYEAEGYAFLMSKTESDEETPHKIPRLIARRPLSFPVSLLLALIRKQLAELDTSGGDARLVLSRDEIVETIRVFLPESSNEAKLIDNIETHLNKIVELGFLRRLKSTNNGMTDSFEVRRILKAFVDAQWLTEFDTKLASYQAHLKENTGAQDEV